MTISEATGKDKFTEIETLCQVLLDMVSESESRLTPRALEKSLTQKLSVPKSAFKTAVNSLVADGELVYTYTFGASFLEKSFNRPVRISKKITLKPPGVFYRPVPGEIVVKLMHGASFGTGDHPTTRIAVQGFLPSLPYCSAQKRGWESISIPVREVRQRKTLP
jgi:ribosomal protein L11 methyltransferase